jgi:ABC-type transport system substrate-binding protein
MSNILQIESDMVPTDFLEYLYRLYYHEDYDMVFMAFGFGLLDDPTSMADEYGPGTETTIGTNFPNWVNQTFRDWIPQLRYGSDAEIWEAAIEMQKLYIYENPLMPTYNNDFIVPYRTDRFEGWVWDDVQYLANQMTYLRVHLKESEGGPYGGELRLRIDNPVDSFNPMATSAGYAQAVFNRMWPRPYHRNATAQLVPWLADGMFDTFTHDGALDTIADPSVPEGHMRFEFEMLQNATWLDGTSITAEDFVYSLIYFKDSLAYGNDWGVGQIQDLTSAVALTPYKVRVEFSTVSVWHRNNFAGARFFPKALLETYGPEGWDAWNPVMGADPYPTGGPWMLDEYVEGEFTTLVRDYTRR